ncbi:YybH family protein [Rehaibacterium terrae]|jgi:ketosteroid isomerase-like protein|uniref:Ketosteroid isomerase-like protein n=1 Tax=Rehaibacterium terrae TaxID=1341696 RepID=A0A7W7Y1K9_9GAMM|nr:nuclear transport factor 2 family protein [Rehaibacterium terrae]MBB5016439.1 ketosteroid isomerase-like protein [Rehaibacterium terrae]
MRAALATVLALALLATACAARGPHAVADAARADQAQAQLLQRQTDFFAALSARDLDATLALFADDAVLHVAGMPPIAGREAIARFYGHLFGFLRESRASPTLLRIGAGGDLAYTGGGVVNEFASPQGGSAFTGKYLLVWTRGDGGEWRIAAYSVSSDSSDPRR